MESRVSATIQTAICNLNESRGLEIEASFASGFAGIQLIGNTSEVCRDGKERAKSSLEFLGYKFPPSRILVSLNPGDVRKDGVQYDLPLAVVLSSLLKQENQIRDLNQYVFTGELSLNGRLLYTKGAIGFALYALSSGKEGIVVPRANLEELKPLLSLPICLERKFKIIGFDDLSEVIDWLHGGLIVECLEQVSSKKALNTSFQPSFDDMQLDNKLEELAAVIAVGSHSVLLRGSPGVGKSMFAERLPCLLPNLEAADHVEALKNHSFQSGRPPLPLIHGRPPFRAPHHSASANALIGSGDSPGDVSLAHGGVLFLDEFPEFRRDLIEALREPLETGKIRVSRAKSKVEWNAKFLLLAACNNCPCGWYGSETRTCSCPVSKIQAYQRKLSGPILDRIDIHVNLPEPRFDDEDSFVCLKAIESKAESRTQILKKRVDEAKEFGIKRNGYQGVIKNSEIPSQSLVSVSGRAERDFLTSIKDIYPSNISNRSLVRSLRVARSLADLNLSSQIENSHLETAAGWLAVNGAIERGELI